MDDKYDPNIVELRWQRRWDDEHAWRVLNDDDADEASSYVLEMLPYPSGEPHMGHLKVYAVGDAVAHYQRRTGHTVLHPMGYDAFGLPAENHAIRTGRHPRASTEEAIAEFRRQFRRWGMSIDWSREFSTHEPSYYRWTQRIFLQLHEAGLAYRKDAAVKWCPEDQTVLANEQVVDGACERCGAEVELRQLEQWFFRTSAYAERLLDDLETIEWPASVKTMQRNWIGRSAGAEVTFTCAALDVDFDVFTTRPDTLDGATFFVLAPEHPDAVRLAADTEHEAAVRTYVNQVAGRPAEQRGAADRPKTGVFTGRTVTNPVNGDELPVYVADYVLMDYGTGAVMAVPALDERDRAFAEAHDLPIKPTELRDDIVDELVERGVGRPAVSFRLRDWLLSRQRYWGCPIPIVHCDACGAVPVPEDQLPVELPDVEDYAPQGRSPLAAAEDWVATTCPSCGAPARRETDTMDTFVDSSWYFLRYCDARNDAAAWDPAAIRRWMPVGQYIGGIEHAILHLLYARFLCKALSDLGHLDVQEPFARLFTQGMITRNGAKMSKNRGNVVSPRDIVDRYGADTARAYVLSMGPPDQDADWNDDGVAGMHRFLARVHRLAAWAAELPAGPVGDPAALSRDGVRIARAAHRAIAKVTTELDGRFGLNTALAAIRELVNEVREERRGDAEPEVMRFAVETAASLLFPFAPHLAAEAYAHLTGEDVWRVAWPQPDPAFLVEDTFELVVQIDGRVRDRVRAHAGATDAELLALARRQPNAAVFLEGRAVAKEVVVRDRLVNFVTGA